MSQALTIVRSKRKKGEFGQLCDSSVSDAGLFIMPP
jgi:hypothetical protein